MSKKYIEFLSRKNPIFGVKKQYLRSFESKQDGFKSIFVRLFTALKYYRVYWARGPQSRNNFKHPVIYTLKKYPKSFSKKDLSRVPTGLKF